MRPDHRKADQIEILEDTNALKVCAYIPKRIYAQIYFKLLLF